MKSCGPSRPSASLRWHWDIRGRLDLLGQLGGLRMNWIESCIESIGRCIGRRPVTTRLPSPEAVLKPSDRLVSLSQEQRLNLLSLRSSGSHGATLAWSD